MLRALFKRQPKRHFRGGDFLYTSFTTYSSISYIFLLYFTIPLKQLRRLYTGGFIFQVPPVYNYSTCCTNRVLTWLVHQVRIYAFSVPTTCLYIWCTNHLLVKHWLIRGEAHQYIDHVVCFGTGSKSPPSKRAYNTIRISCFWIWLTCIIKLIQTARYISILGILIRSI